MDSRDDWRWCKWYEANCIRELHTNYVMPIPSAWMKDWTLFGKIHLHKLISGRSDRLLFGYNYAWEHFLRTDTECVRMKRMCDLYIN